MSPAAAPVLHPIDTADFLADVRVVASRLVESGWSPDFIIGIGRGGLVPAVYLSHQLDIPMLSIDHSSRVPGFADDLLAKVATMSAAPARLLFVDDINDSGGTIAYIRDVLVASGADVANLRFAVLIDNAHSKMRVDYRSQTIDRREDKRWFVFPWEAVGTTETIVAEALSVPERLA